jgi:hypothetical protein
MGDCQTEPLRPQFDRRLRLEFHGANVTSDAGLLAYRELDDALNLTNSAAAQLQDTRTGQNTQHTPAALLRQSIYSRLAGYEDLNDAERLRVDPTMRTVVGGRAKDHTAASTSEIARFETATLAKIGAKVVSRSKSLTFQMAEVAVLRALFAAILERIDQLRLVPGTG